MSHNYLDWAKYQNRHSSKSIKVTKKVFCQNDSPIGGSFGQKDSLITDILFEHMPIMISNQVANLMHHPLYLHIFQHNNIKTKLLRNLLTHIQYVY